MRKICVINQKGGIGKTTTALNIAAGISRFEKKVLLIDLDPQSNIELSITLTSEKTAYHFLFEDKPLAECINNLGKNLDMVKGDKDIVYTDQDILNNKQGEIRIKNRFATIKDYDYVIFDCGPSMSAINRCALLYVDEVIVPTSSDYLGYESLKKMMNTLQEFSQRNSHKLIVSKIVPTLYDQRNNICKDTLKKLQNEYYQVVSNPINLNSKLKEAPMHKMSIFKYAPSSPGAKDYLALVQDIISDEQKHGTKETHLSEYTTRKKGRATA